MEPDDIVLTESSQSALDKDSTAFDAGQSPSHSFRACDQCRRRKTKCDGKYPCAGCDKAVLKCTNDDPRKRRGPRSDKIVLTSLRQIGNATPLAEHQLLMATVEDIAIPSPTDLDTYSVSSQSSSTFKIRAEELRTSQYPNPQPRSIPSTFDQAQPPPTPFHTISRSGGMNTPQSTNGDSLYERDPLWSSERAKSSLDGFVTSAFAGELHSMSTTDYNSFPRAQSKQDDNEASPFIHLDPSSEALPPQETLFVPTWQRHSQNSVSYMAPGIESCATELGVAPLLIDQCVRQFFSRLHKTLPILDESQIWESLDGYRVEAIDKSVLLSLCAVTILRACPIFEFDMSSRHALVRQCIEKCLQMRTGFLWAEWDPLKTAVVSHFVSLCYLDLEKRTSHQFYLQEAISIVEDLANLPHGSTRQQEATGQECYQNLVNLLFINDISLAIQQHRPPRLSRTEYFVTSQSLSFSANDSNGLQPLIRLLSLVNDDVLELYRKPLTSSVDEKADMLKSVQTNLELFDDTATTPHCQKLNVAITTQWLRLVIWQLSLRIGLVSSESSDAEFRFDFPVQIARTLCSTIKDLSLEYIHLHGLAIHEKIFEVAFALVNTLQVMKAPVNSNYEVHFLHSCISLSPQPRKTYGTLLKSTIESSLDSTGSGQDSTG